MVNLMLFSIVLWN